VQERAAKIRQRLAKAIPSPQVELDFENGWQLLMATMLAAQSTDKTINTITPELFARYPTPAALAVAPQEDVEVIVRRSGYFRQKAKAIRRASQVIVAEHDGEVPRDIETLVSLPGVARKTANVVLGCAYGIASGIVVDTHCKRLSNRLGLTSADEPTRIEEDLQQLFHRRSWISVSHRIILHGRYVCVARAPKCDRCPLHELCPSAGDGPAGTWTQRARWEQRLVESRGVDDSG
jgi:endonuclease-3